MWQNGVGETYVVNASIYNPENRKRKLLIKA
jgi:hypothetical protein